MENSCDLVVCPELTVSGYWPEDHLLRPDVQNALTQATDELVEEFLNFKNAPAIIFGAARVVEGTPNGHVYDFPQGLVTANTLDFGAFALANGAMIVNPNTSSVSEVYKAFLPNWSVFDEARIFARASQVADPIEIAGVKVGVAICRDIWKESVVHDLVQRGAEIIVVPNASPYANARHGERIKAISAYAQNYEIPIVYVNMIEGCDEVVCEGGSFAIDATGETIAVAPRFEESLLAFNVEIGSVNANAQRSDVSVDLSGSLLHDEFNADEAYQAVVLGTREFLNAVDESSRVSIGLSGGVDSALVATIAVDAIGPDRVEGVLMPSRFTSEQSITDAIELAARLGITTRTIAIEKLFETASIELELESMPSIVSENVQARLRGVVLMMLSNSEGFLPLATSNKSESAVGYCTLYGDTVGAYAPIKDVYKTQVYEMCAWRNAVNNYDVHNPIPADIIERPPTAELRENQTDEDSLMPYEILDGILQRYVDWDMGIDAIITEGFIKQDVLKVAGLVNSSEFKRKQTPPGPRLTRRNFGKGRRVPISAKI